MHRRSVVSNEDLNSWNEEEQALRESAPYPSNSVETIREPRNTSNELSCLEDVTYGSVAFLQSWFPTVNPTHPRAKTWRTRMARQKVVLWACFVIVSTICITNFVLAVLLWSRDESSPDGVVTLYQGDCTVVRRADTATHLLINILSTLLMGASNMTLELIGAPTRKEVDKAHRAGTWLDIGVLSFRNLSRTSRVSCTIWCCLALSSIPIHFLYNSAVFSSISTNEFAWVVATETFLTGGEWPANTTTGNTTAEPGSSVYQGATQGYYSMPDDGSFASVSIIHNDYHENPRLYENHTTYDCLKAYRTPFAWRPSQLIMVSSNTSSSQQLNSSTLLAWGIIKQQNYAGQPLCVSSLDMKKKCSSLDALNPQNIGEFTYLDDDLVIDYCLFKATDVIKTLVNTCQLQSSPQILIVVACFNAIKCACILWIILRKNGPTMCILGDAIASFLDIPDIYTENMGITSMRNIKHSGKTWSMSQGRRVPWQPSRVPWREAASARRRIFVIISSVIFLTGGFAALTNGLLNQRKQQRSISMSSLWAMGFGETNVREVIKWGQPEYGRLGIFVNTVIANIWQVLMSLLYTTQNALLSCMLVAEEWSGFAADRKTLRVSAPIGIQRSNYSLSMPVKYGIPMMIVFTIEHWLLSQATFVVRANRVSWNGDHIEGWTITGYSFMPCLTSGLLYFCIVVAQLLLGAKHYPENPAMPFASTCSAAISAACHRPEADKDAHLLPVQWGVVGQDESGLQRCAFTTSRHVQPPTKGSSLLGMPVQDKKRRSFLPSLFSMNKKQKK